MTRLALALLTFTAAACAVHDDRPTLSVTAARGYELPPRAPHSSRLHRRTPRPAPTPPQHGPRHLLSVTAYCATGNRTASGAWPQLGMAAGNRWPFGTRLHVEHVGDVVITDRIGWGSELDLYFGADAGCEQRAARFGRRQLTVTEVTK
jgi:3D (Asp-Asp-Asp) domain-containing protein